MSPPLLVRRLLLSPSSELRKVEISEPLAKNKPHLMQDPLTSSISMPQDRSEDWSESIRARSLTRRDS